MSIYDLTEVHKRLKRRAANPVNVFDTVEMKKLFEQLKEQKCSTDSQLRSSRRK